MPEAEAEDERPTTPIQVSNAPTFNNEESQARPQTNVSNKQKELEELARLIQAATGSINNVVESSQQFKFNQGDRSERGNRSRFQAGKAVESVQLSGPNNLPALEKRIEEDNHNDNQILSDLDLIIQNLEKQQQESEKANNKFSSNTGFVSQMANPELERQYEDAINESLNLQKQGTSGQKETIHEEIIEQSLATNQQPGLPGASPRPDEHLESESNNIRETINVDQLGRGGSNLKIQRPISGKSQISNSTRYNQTANIKR